MFAFIEAAGWPVWPLVIASIIALAIIGERAWSLRTRAVAPPELLGQVVQEYRQNGANPQLMARLSSGGPLAQILAAGLKNVKSTPQLMKEAIDDTGRAVAHELERFLTTLGTIASISPLLGLLGTVIGLIHAFSAVATVNPAEKANLLSASISVAMNCTAFGLMTAVPILFAHAFLQTKTTEIIDSLEMASVKFLNAITERTKDTPAPQPAAA